FESALAAGTNLAFMGSNDAYWNVKYEDGEQTIFTYKSTYDPNPDPAQKTAMFREIGRPECLLIGGQHADIRALGHARDYSVTRAGVLVGPRRLAQRRHACALGPGRLRPLGAGGSTRPAVHAQRARRSDTTRGAARRPRGRSPSRNPGSHPLAERPANRRPSR